MKLLYLFLPMLLSPFVFTNAADPIEKTAELIRQADIHELAKSFASTIELNILDEENIYSNTQAELVLANFFSHNQPKSVKILHRITSNPNYRFAVLILTTDNGVYRISFSLKSNKGQFEMNELRIETEKTK